MLPKGYELISIELSVAGVAGARWPRRHQLLEQHAVRSGGDAARPPGRAICRRPVERRRHASTSARTRIERSCISSSSRRRTRSICITTTPSRASESSTYINEVRAGSTVSNPRAKNLDTGEDLKWEILKGDAITAAKLDVANVTPQSEIVVFRFAPVKQGESVRLRMFETYTDTARYKVVGDELMWDRSFGRPANAVVLPAGWVLTNSSIPATVSTMPDGRVRLDFVNPRPDEIAVLITARKRP